MPSNRQSWWARHCTPPPPISAASSCPCGSCFNKSFQDAAQLQFQAQQLQAQKLQLQQQQEREQEQERQREQSKQILRQQHKTQRSSKAWGEKPLRVMDSMAPLLLNKKDSDRMSMASSFSEGSIYHLEHAMDQ